jgi:hypothetical protein
VSEKRRDVRYPARILVRVVRRGETTELLTNDVSFRGAFVRTDAPPVLRQLVKVSFTLPEGSSVSAHAMIVHAIEAVRGEDGTRTNVPGVGIQFWGPIEQARAWEQFIHDLKRKEKAGVAAARLTDKVRRASERFKLALDVTLDGRSFQTRDVSETGIAIRSESPMPVGTRVQLSLRTAEQTITLDVIVRRRIDEPGFKGLGVEFVDVAPADRKALVALVRTNAPREEVIFVQPGDPKLH